jgi:hypothetical protein
VANAVLGGVRLFEELHDRAKSVRYWQALINVTANPVSGDPEGFSWDRNRHFAALNE